MLPNEQLKVGHITMLPDEQLILDKYKDVACGIILRSEGKFLLGKITGYRGANQWSVFKGKCETGEDFLTAALRELGEEANIHIGLSDLKGLISLSLGPIHTYYMKKKKKFVVIFFVDDVSGQIKARSDIKCMSFFKIKEREHPEIMDFKWVDFSELSDHLIPSQQGLVADLGKTLERWDDRSTSVGIGNESANIN